MEIVLETNNEHNATIIKAEGRLDAITVTDFEEKVVPLSVSGTQNLIIDFSNLVYISSAGLRAILKIAKGCKEKSCKLVLCSLSKEVSEVFKISGFDLIVNIKSDLESALACI